MAYTKRTCVVGYWLVHTEPRCYYWEVIEQSRKLALTGLMIFVQASGVV